MEHEEYSNHNIVINKIAQQMNCDVKLIRRIVNNFFSRYGIKFFMSKGNAVKVYGLGKFVPKVKGAQSMVTKKKKVQLFKRRRKYRTLKEKNVNNLFISNLK